MSDTVVNPLQNERFYNEICKKMWKIVLLILSKTRDFTTSLDNSCKTCKLLILSKTRHFTTTIKQLQL